MADKTEFGSEKFKFVASGLVSIHRLIKAGKEDSPEAESIRDTLDAPLRSLNPIEKKRAQYLSEDLYSLSKPTSTPPKKMTPDEHTKLVEFHRAMKNQEWDKALALLRELRGYLATVTLSTFRGYIWLESGNLDIASEFYQDAIERASGNAGFKGG